MTELANTTPTVARYWGELKDISDEEKLNLIVLLSSSYKSSERKRLKLD